jgi:hypothetical protein
MSLTYATIVTAMTDLAARPLILTSGVLLALFDVVALLPGNPVVSGAQSFAVIVAVQALVIWRLWHRSGLAWFFGVVTAAFYSVSVILVGGPWETTLVATSLLTLLQVAVLCTPPVLVYVWRQDKAVASH